MKRVRNYRVLRPVAWWLAVLCLAMWNIPPAAAFRKPQQRKPGKTKGGTDGKPGTAVKTGASDSAWLRDVLDLASPGEILIVSADRDVSAAFTAA